MTSFTSVGSIATAAHDYLDSPSSGVSGAMVNFASGAVLELSGFVNESISAPIAAKYQNVLIDMTVLRARLRQLDEGSDSDYSLGELSVKKGAGTAPDASIQRLEKKIEAQVNSLGRKLDYYRTF